MAIAGDEVKRHPEARLEYRDVGLHWTPRSDQVCAAARVTRTIVQASSSEFDDLATRARSGLAAEFRPASLLVEGTIEEDYILRGKAPRE